MSNCPSCNLSNVYKFKAWVEDVDNPKFDNTYNEAYWNFIVWKNQKTKKVNYIG